MGVKIDRKRTAISRSMPSAPTRWACDNGYIPKGSVVFDYGCGKGRDMEYLNSVGCAATGYDPHYFPDNHNGRINFTMFDVVLCNYVLNIIEDKKERSALVENIFSRAIEGTTVIVSVRSASHIRSTAKRNKWQKYRDGFITKHNTFQKGYSKEELIKYLKDSGAGDNIECVNTSNGIICVVIV